MNILIIKLGAAGDVLRTTSVLEGLKEKHKPSKIAWLTNPFSSDLLKGNPFLDSVFMPSDSGTLRNVQWDWIINLDDDEKACQIASELKPKKITGAWLKEGKRAYTEDSRQWFDMGLISRFGKQKADELKKANKKTHQQILGEMLKIEMSEPVLALKKEDIAFADAFAKKNGIKKGDKVIGINTGAGGRWQDKKLSIDKTAEVIDRLNEDGKCKLILFGGPEEEERNRKIIGRVSSQLIDAGCHNTLMQFAALVNLCSVLVTSDSLAMHIGIALKKRAVAFFGPTSSAEIEMYGRGTKIIPRTGCLCCYRDKCDIPPDYSVDEMAKAARKYL
ncbi:glycosyltransferase family 9 protein [Candidatus Woesearchaeota archaeon]|nr:glycosyltransferase family 9 protein [Candidatus Woesearchaeota archaeon]